VADCPFETLKNRNLRTHLTKSHRLDRGEAWAAAAGAVRAEVEIPYTCGVCGRCFPNAAARGSHTFWTHPPAEQEPARALGTFMY
jgi:hypothetical protein